MAIKTIKNDSNFEEYSMFKYVACKKPEKCLFSSRTTMDGSRRGTGFGTAPLVLRSWSFSFLHCRSPPSFPRDGGESRSKIGKILYLLWFVMRGSWSQNQAALGFYDHRTAHLPEPSMVVCGLVFVLIEMAGKWVLNFFSTMEPQNILVSTDYFYPSYVNENSNWCEKIVPSQRPDVNLKNV